TYRLPYKYQAEFKQAERDAREQGRGLWAPSACNGEHRPADESPGTVATSAPPTAAPAQAPTPTNAPPGGVPITRTPARVRRGARGGAQSGRLSCATRAGRARRRGWGRRPPTRVAT